MLDMGFLVGRSKDLYGIPEKDRPFFSATIDKKISRYSRMRKMILL
jgi:hypothetical protein